MNAIEVVSISRQYGKVKALNNLGLNVPAGKIYGLVGPNGAGKTTLIKSLVGSVKPDSGSIKVLGLDPIQDKWQLRKLIGYMPQSPALYDDLSPRNNILFFGKGQGVTDLQKKTDDILTFMELSNRAHDTVGTFSGGMKKRVSLSCALIHDPKIIFLDEPTAALDPHLKLQSWIHFRNMAQSGVTIVISTHLMDEALLCDMVAILRLGEIIAMDTPGQILQLGKTNLKITIDGEEQNAIIDSDPESLAIELKKYGLAQNISSLQIQADSIEDIILDIAANKSGEERQ